MGILTFPSAGSPEEPSHFRRVCERAPWSRSAWSTWASRKETCRLTILTKACRGSGETRCHGCLQPPSRLPHGRQALGDLRLAGALLGAPSETLTVTVMPPLGAPACEPPLVSFLLLPLFRLFHRGEKPMVREVGPPAQSHTARQQQRGDSGCTTLFMKTEVFRNRSLLSFWSGRATCRLLVPRPEIKPVPPAVEAWSPNPWAIREFPEVARFNI